MPPPKSLNTDASEGAESLSVEGVHLASKPPNSLWNIFCNKGTISSISEYNPGSGSGPDGRFVGPSLCHPHIHIDKCFLLSHPKFTDLEIQDGDFQEAMRLTSKAKSRFELDDLMERGRALIEESINFGVTHMRAFVEVDEAVGMKCLDAGLALKEEFQGRCYVQICVFAQDPIFSNNETVMKDLLYAAASRPCVEVLGSTPYVETRQTPGEDAWHYQLMNVLWTLKIAGQLGLHVDFHLDYNLNAKEEPIFPKALHELTMHSWSLDKTAVFGHCTRLTLFDILEWNGLQRDVGNSRRKISFVGLPTSDLFMMGRPLGQAQDTSDQPGKRPRGTLQILQMIKEWKINCGLGINNVGNAFTPHGNCDPLSLASFGVGVYQAGTKKDAEILYECVSSRAKSAIGLSPWKSFDVELKVGDPADFVIFGPKSGTRSFRSRRSIHDLVYDAGYERETVYGGRVVSR